MAANLTIESPASSTEEEYSSEDDHQSMEQQRKIHSAVSSEGSSEDEESDGSEDFDPRSKCSSEGSAVNVNEQNIVLSENKKEEESGHSDPKPKTDSKIPTVNVQEEGDDSSEEDDSEQEEEEDFDWKPNSVLEAARARKEMEEVVGEEEEDFDGPKAVNQGNKEPRTGMVPLKIKTGGENCKNELFKRVWSLEDEKTLLNSQLLFRAETGKEVDNSTMEPFCEFLTGKLGFTERPGLRQVSQKIKSLKRKYSANRFSKQHDLAMKKIAIQLWGSDANSKSSKRKFSLLDEETKKLKINTSQKKLNFEHNSDKAEALDQKIKKLRILETKLQTKRIDLKKETFKLLLNDMKY